METRYLSDRSLQKSPRGSGYAREFLKWLAKFFNGLGKRAYLLALDVRVSFYQEIGFREVEQEIVLERIDVEKDSVMKGKLAEMNSRINEDLRFRPEAYRACKKG